MPRTTLAALLRPHGASRPVVDSESSGVEPFINNRSVPERGRRLVEVATIPVPYEKRFGLVSLCAARAYITQEEVVMAKEALKAKISERQNRTCAICGEEVSEEAALVDTDRINPKASAGEYTDENTRIVHPVCHFKRHGIYRDRGDMLASLKAVIDDREQIRKLALRTNNQLLAYKRRVDHLNEITKAWLEAEQEKLDRELKGRDALLLGQVKAIAETETVEGRVATSALGVKGIGHVTIAYCLAYIDIEKDRHASSLWAYVGLDKPSYARYEKGTVSGGNKSLRTMLYTMADSQMKTRGAYRLVYDNTKHRLAHSEKVTKTRNTKGQLVECMWKDTKPGHRHGAALRAVMKHFLADLWMVWRTTAGLETSPLYPEAMLGGAHRTIQPEERGWVY